MKKRILSIVRSRTAVRTIVLYSCIGCVASANLAVAQAPSDLKPVASAPQIAFGGVWNTTLALTNNSANQVSVRISFFDDQGNALQAPLTLPQSSAVAANSTVDQTIAPGAVLIVQTAGASGQPTTTGWAQVLANGNVGGFVVFTATSGNGVQNFTAPLETRNPGSFVVLFDQTSGASDGIGLANLSNQPATVLIIVRDEAGNVMGSATQSLPAMGHAEFAATDISSASRNARGTFEFQTPQGGQISVVGIAGLSNGSLVAIPPSAK